MGFSYSEPIYVNSQAQIITNTNDFLPSLELSQQQLLNGIGVWLSKGSEWTITRIDGHYINVAVSKPLDGNSYITLPEELQHRKKGLVNIKNEDNKCFLWSHARHKNLNVRNPQRITKLDRETAEHVFNYKGVEFPEVLKIILK